MTTTLVARGAGGAGTPLSPARKFATLMRREWLQHRFGWTMAALLPIAIALLLVAFGQVQIGDEAIESTGEMLPVMLALGALAGSTAVVFAILVITSLIITANIARRDHGDRSVEFWLSMPVGHGGSLAAPLVTHLLLVPAVGLLVGLAGGALISLVLVARAAGVGAWFALPWAEILPAALAIVGRLLAGLPLAVLWVLPLVLLLVLLTAWARGWGWVIFAVGIGLGSALLDSLFGQPWPAEILGELLANAARALLFVNDGGLKVGPNEGLEVLHALPGWLLADLGHALRALASPLLAGGLVFAAGCFWLLMRWRERGASAGA
jgi:hypothetical protein